MINIKLLVSIFTSIISILLIYASHDINKPSYIWILAITSVIFTLSLIVHDRINEYKDEKNLKKMISPIVRGIIGMNSSWFHMMSVDARKPKLNLRDLNQENLLDVLKNINPNAKSPIVSQNEGYQLKWTQFLLQLCLLTNLKVDNILPNSSRIDTELLRILSEIKNCLLLKEMQIQAYQNVGNTDFSYEVKQIFDYFRTIQKLDIFYTKKLKKSDEGNIQNSMIPFLGKMANK